MISSKRWTSFFGGIVDLVPRIRYVAGWLPLLWHSVDWDMDDAVKLIMYKLERMDREIRRQNHHLNCDKVARDIRITIEHFKRYRDPDKYSPPWPGPEIRWIREEGKPTRLARMTAAQAMRMRRMEWATNANWHAAWEMIRKRGRTWWD